MAQNHRTSILGSWNSHWLVWNWKLWLLKKKKDCFEIISDPIIGYDWYLLAVVPVHPIHRIWYEQVCQNAETSTEVFRERGKQNVVLRNHDSSAGETAFRLAGTWRCPCFCWDRVVSSQTLRSHYHDTQTALVAHRFSRFTSRRRRRRRR